MGENRPDLSEAVCEFSGVRLDNGGGAPLEFCIRRGELWIVELPRAGARPDVAGAASGTSKVLEGAVRVLGCDWATDNLDAAEAARRRTGRVFDARHGPIWLQNLHIGENLLLPHTITGCEPVAETMRRMEAIGKEFGFDEIPKTRPSVTSHRVSQSAQCVRAFMRRQLDFLILEVPTRQADALVATVLRRKVAEVLDGGCGVLWITDRSEADGNVPRDLAKGAVFYGKSRWTGEEDVDED